MYSQNISSRANDLDGDIQRPRSAGIQFPWDNVDEWI